MNAAALVADKGAWPRSVIHSLRGPHVRLHWGIENDVHHTLDTAFAEDDRPWLDTHPRGALVVALLRRIAYNLMALFRSVTQRSHERRASPWRALLQALERTLITLTLDALAGLRPRRLLC